MQKRRGEDLVLYPKFTHLQLDRIKGAVYGLDATFRRTSNSGTRTFHGFGASLADLRSGQMDFRAMPSLLEDHSLTIAPLGAIQLSQSDPGHGRWPLTSIYSVKLLWRETRFELRLRGRALRRGAASVQCTVQLTRRQLRLIETAKNRITEAFGKPSPGLDVSYFGGFLASRYGIREGKIELTELATLDPIAQKITVSPLGVVLPTYRLKTQSTVSGRQRYLVRLSEDDAKWRCELYERSVQSALPREYSESLSLHVEMSPQQLSILKIAVQRIIDKLNADPSLTYFDFASIRGTRTDVYRGQVEFTEALSADIDAGHFSIWPLGRLNCITDGDARHDRLRFMPRKAKLRWRDERWEVELSGIIEKRTHIDPRYGAYRASVGKRAGTHRAQAVKRTGNESYMTRLEDLLRRLRKDEEKGSGAFASPLGRTPSGKRASFVQGGAVGLGRRK